MLSTHTTTIVRSFGNHPITAPDIYASTNKPSYRDAKSLIEKEVRALSSTYDLFGDGWIGRLPTAIRGEEMLSSAPIVNVQPGMRVELTGKPTAVTLRGRTGTVVREDEDEDYVIVKLDTPALYRHFNGEVEELPEIVVMIDNLRVLGF